MPYRDGFFGPWPSGPDFESSTPAMWIELDKDLAGRTRYQAENVAERDTAFPRSSLTSRDRPIVDIPSLGERHAWDGANWLIWDDQPRVYPGYIYNGIDLTPYSLGTGGYVQSTYQRRGHWCDMQMTTKWGSNANQGIDGEASTWYLSYEPYDMFQTGTAVWRNPSTASWLGAVSLVNWHNFVIVENGDRWEAQTHKPVEGTTISVQMTYRLKVTS